MFLVYSLVSLFFVQCYDLFISKVLTVVSCYQVFYRALQRANRTLKQVLCMVANRLCDWPLDGSANPTSDSPNLRDDRWWFSKVFWRRLIAWRVRVRGMMMIFQTESTTATQWHFSRSSPSLWRPRSMSVPQYTAGRQPTSPPVTRPSPTTSAGSATPIIYLRPPLRCLPDRELCCVNKFLDSQVLSSDTSATTSGSP